MWLFFFEKGKVEAEMKHSSIQRRIRVHEIHHSSRHSAFFLLRIFRFWFFLEQQENQKAIDKEAGSSKLSSSIENHVTNGFPSERIEQKIEIYFAYVGLASEFFISNLERVFETTLAKHSERHSNEESSPAFFGRDLERIFGSNVCNQFGVLLRRTGLHKL